MIGEQFNFDFGDGHAPSAPRDVTATAIVVPFPLHGRKRKILATAVALNARKTSETRDRYWKRVVTVLAAELRRHGATSSEIDRQLMEFRAAVAEQMMGERNQRPSGGQA